MDKDFAADLITLLDDEGTEHVFEILDIIESDNGIFYALFPVYDTPEEQIESDGEYYIFQVATEDGEEVLTEIEDEDLLDTLAEEFERRFEEIYDMNEEAETEE